MVLPIRRELTGAPESRGLFCGRDGRAPRSSLGGLVCDACGTPGLRMLRILQPGLHCFAPSVLGSPAIGTQAPKARVRAGCAEEISPGWKIRTGEEVTPLQHQAHLWCSQYEGNSRECRSRAGFFAAETAALPGVRDACGTPGLRMLRTCGACVADTDSDSGR